MVESINCHEVTNFVSACTTVKINRVHMCLCHTKIVTVHLEKKLDWTPGVFTKKNMQWGHSPFNFFEVSKLSRLFPNLLYSSKVSPNMHLHVICAYEVVQ